MDVLDEVKQIIAKQARVPIDQLTADTRLETLGIESIDVIEIVFALEEKFGVTLPFNANEFGGLRIRDDRESRERRESRGGRKSPFMN